MYINGFYADIIINRKWKLEARGFEHWRGKT